MRVTGHVLAGVFEILLRFPSRSQEQRDIRVQAWAGQALRHLGVELMVRGAPPVAGPVLIVANHISWLDIVVLHAARHCRFVSKDDVRGWPLVGTMATGAGTLYVKRSSSRDAMRVVHHMSQALKDGDILAVFPEGTTGDGAQLLPFHANLLQAAISAPAPVLPVGLGYTEGTPAQPTQAVSYVGDESLLGSLWRTLCARKLRAYVHYGAIEHADGRTRRAWAQDLRNQVERLRKS